MPIAPTKPRIKPRPKVAPQPKVNPFPPEKWCPDQVKRIFDV